MAVLAIFGEVGVNPTLYFLVFGESLLNDGVAVVFYQMMDKFSRMESHGVAVSPRQILLGILSFLTVALGGLAIGVLFGVATSLLTRWTRNVRLIEPVIILSMGYLAYLTADSASWSGIISLIGCGIIQAHYAFKNISSVSLNTVEQAIKILSSISDSIIFLYLGMALSSIHLPSCDPWFALWAILICFIVRYLGVFSLTLMVSSDIDLRSQLVMGYAGLRGAVGFSLVCMINKEEIDSAEMFKTTTLAVIVFTVFVQGGTIRYLVNLFGIEKSAQRDINLSDEIHGRLIDQVMSGMEVIAGERGHFYGLQKLTSLDQVRLSLPCL